MCWVHVLLSIAGRANESAENTGLIKTSVNTMNGLNSDKDDASYELPKWLVPMMGGLPAYLQWIATETQLPD